MYLRNVALLGAAIALTGCITYDTGPLVFTQTDVLGVSVGASSTKQGADFNIGYTGQGVAIIPVYTPEGTLITSRKYIDGEPVLEENINRESVPSEDDAHNSDGGGGAAYAYDGPDEDTFAVLGQFAADSEASSTAAKVGLSKFFATGFAARILAQGFAASMTPNATAPSPAPPASPVLPVIPAVPPVVSPPATP